MVDVVCVCPCVCILNTSVTGRVSYTEDLWSGHVKKRTQELDLYHKLMESPFYGRMESPWSASLIAIRRVFTQQLLLLTPNKLIF